MRIIKVDAIDSTNTFLSDLYREERFVESVCVVAREQYAGKGQMGATWQSDPGDNLLCSVFMPIEGVALLEQFYISIAVSLTVYDTLARFLMPKLVIKWPNDILSERLKVCGILIENIVNNGSLRGVIVGVGMNINQINFTNLPSAGSFKKILGEKINIEEVLTVFLDKLEDRFSQLYISNYQNLKKEYESLLFRKNKPSTFIGVEGKSFVGIIQGVTSTGKLRVLLEDEKSKDFDLKEIKLLY